jgi:hypothetical protein
MAWAEWWSSPMASAWIDADQVALRRAVRLVDAEARGDTSASAPLTALEDRLGLSPMARRRLQWEVERSREPAPVVALPVRTSDPRRT